MPNFGQLSGKPSSVSSGTGGTSGSGTGTGAKERYLKGQMYKKHKDGFWANPQNINKYNSTLSTLSDAEKPKWANASGLSEAYKYLEQYNANKPLEQWQAPQNWDDPYWEIVDTIGTPSAEDVPLEDIGATKWSRADKYLSDQGLKGVRKEELGKYLGEDELRSVEYSNIEQGITNYVDPTLLYVDKKSYDQIIATRGTPDPYESLPLDQKILYPLSGRPGNVDPNDVTGAQAGFEAAKSSLVPGLITAGMTAASASTPAGAAKMFAQGAIGTGKTALEVGVAKGFIQEARKQLTDNGVSPEFADKALSAVSKGFDTAMLYPQMPSEIFKRVMGMWNLTSYLSQKEGFGNAVKKVFDNLPAAWWVSQHEHRMDAYNESIRDLSPETRAQDEANLQTLMNGLGLKPVEGAEERKKMLETADAQTYKEAKSVYVLGKKDAVSELTDDQLKDKAYLEFFDKAKAIYDGNSDQSLDDLSREIEDRYGLRGEESDLLRSTVLDPTLYIPGGLVESGLSKAVLGNSKFANVMSRATDSVRGLQDYSARVGVDPRLSQDFEGGTKVGIALQKAANGLIGVRLEKVTTEDGKTVDRIKTAFDEAPKTAIGKMNIFRPTAESLAKADVEIMNDSLRRKASELRNDPKALARFLREISANKPTVAEDVARENGIGHDVRVVVAMMRDKKVKEEVDKIDREFSESASARELLMQLMDVVGDRKTVDGKEMVNVQEFLDRIQNMSADGYLKLKQTLQSSTHPKAATVLGLLDSETDFFRFKKQAELFSTGRWHITPERASYAMIEATLGGMSKYATETLGLKKMSWLHNVSSAMKTANTLAVLWNNPWYVVNNMISDTAYNVIWNNFVIDPKFQKNMIDKYGQEMIPSRLGGLMEETHLVDILHEATEIDPAKRLGISPQKLLGFAQAKAINQLAHLARNDSKIGKAAENQSAAIRFITDGLPNISGTLAKKWEQFSGLNSYLKQMNLYFERTFPQVVEQLEHAFPKALRDNFEETGVDVHALHTLLKSVSKPEDIDRLITGSYTLVPVDSVMSPENKELLRKYGVYDSLSKDIDSAKSVDDVNSIFFKARNMLREKAIEKVYKDVEKISFDTANKVKASGTRYVLPILSDIYRVHQQAVIDSFDNLGKIIHNDKLSGEERSRLIDMESRKWDVYWAQEEAIYSGVITALDGDTSLQAEEIRQAFSMRKSMWKEFYKTKGDFNGVLGYAAHFNDEEFGKNLETLKTLTIDILSRTKHISLEEATELFSEKYNFSNQKEFEGVHDRINDEYYLDVSSHDSDVFETVLEAVKVSAHGKGLNKDAFESWGNRMLSNKNMEDAITDVIMRGNFTRLEAMVADAKSGDPIRSKRLEGILARYKKLAEIASPDLRKKKMNDYRKRILYDNFTYTLPDGIQKEYEESLPTKGNFESRTNSALDTLFQADKSGELILKVVKSVSKAKGIQEAKNFLDLTKLSGWKGKENVLRALEKAASEQIVKNNEAQAKAAEEAAKPPVDTTELAQELTATPVDNTSAFEALKSSMGEVKDVRSFYNLLESLMERGGFSSDNFEDWKVSTDEENEASIHSFKVKALGAECGELVRDFATENLTKTWSDYIDSHDTIKGKITPKEVIDAHVDLVNSLVDGVAKRTRTSRAEIMDKYLGALAEASMSDANGKNISLKEHITNIVMISKESPRPDTLAHELIEAYFDLISRDEFRKDYAEDIQVMGIFAGKNLPIIRAKTGELVRPSDSTSDRNAKLFYTKEGKFNYDWLSNTDETSKMARDIAVDGFMYLLSKGGVVSKSGETIRGSVKRDTKQRNALFDPEMVTGGATEASRRIVLPTTPPKYQEHQLVVGDKGVPHVFENGRLIVLSPKKTKGRVFREIVNEKSGTVSLEVASAPIPADYPGKVYYEKLSPEGNVIAKGETAFWHELNTPKYQTSTPLRPRVANNPQMAKAFEAFKTFFVDNVSSLMTYHKGEKVAEEVFRAFLSDDIFKALQRKRSTPDSLSLTAHREVSEYLESPEYQSKAKRVAEVYNEKAKEEALPAGDKLAYRLNKAAQKSGEEFSPESLQKIGEAGNLLDTSLREGKVVKLQTATGVYAVSGDSLKFDSRGQITNGTATLEGKPLMGIKITDIESMSVDATQIWNKAGELVQSPVQKSEDQIKQEKQWQSAYDLAEQKFEKAQRAVNALRRMLKEAEVAKDEVAGREIRVKMAESMDSLEQASRDVEYLKTKLQPPDISVHNQMFNNMRKRGVDPKKFQEELDSLRNDFEVPSGDANKEVSSGNEQFDLQKSADPNAAHWQLKPEDKISNEEKAKFHAEHPLEDYLDILKFTTSRRIADNTLSNLTPEERVTVLTQLKEQKPEAYKYLFGDDDIQMHSQKKSKKVSEVPPARLALGFVENQILPSEGQMFSEILEKADSVLRDTEHLYNRSNDGKSRTEAVNALMQKHGWDENTATKYATGKMLLPSKVGDITPERMFETLKQNNPNLTDAQAKQKVEAVMMQLKGYLGTVSEAHTKVMSEAQRWGLMQKDNSQFNYGMRTNFDRFADMGLPYQFWYSRSALMWAKLAISRPAIFNAYMRWEKFKKNVPTIVNAPNRLKDKIGIPAPWAGDELGGAMFVDPDKVLFPMAQMLQPFEDMEQRKNVVESQTETNLREMWESQEIDDEEYKNALASKKGEIWDKAYEEALDYQATDTSPLSMARMAVQPNYFVDSLANAVLDGKDVPFFGNKYFRKENVQDAPIARNIKTLTGAIGMNDGEGYNIGDPFRRALQLPERVNWDEVNIEKQVVYMAVKGTISPEDAQKALINKGKDVNWVIAKQKAAAYQRTKFLGQGLRLDFFPEPEQKIRELSDEYGDALDALGQGDRTAYNRFLGKHPEYAVQIAAWRDPAVRMRKYVISDIWEKWNELPDLAKKKYQEGLGDTFQDNFLNKSTRNYDNIDNAQLFQWAKTLGSFVPESAGGIAPAPVNLPPQEDVKSYQDYRKLAESMFPSIGAVESKLYSLPEEKQDAYRKQHPILEKYEDWKTQYLGTHPEIVPYTVSEKSQLYGYPPAIQQRVYSYRAQEKQMFPNIYNIQDAYFAQSIGKGRRSYLQKHPELTQYWNWRSRFLAVNEDIASLIMGSSSHSHKLDPTYLTDDDTKNAYDSMNQNTKLGWRDYLQTGTLSSGTRAEMRVIWLKAGKPAETFENFLKELANKVVP
jgi:hypothetical protein